MTSFYEPPAEIPDRILQLAGFDSVWLQIVLKKRLIRLLSNQND